MKRKQMEVVNMENRIIKLSMKGLNGRVDTTEEKNTGNLKDSNISQNLAQKDRNGKYERDVTEAWRAE